MARPIVLFAVDRAGVVTLSEGKELTALGLPVGQVVDRSLFDILRGHAAVIENMRRALTGEKFTASVQVDGRLRAHDRRVPARTVGGCGAPGHLAHTSTMISPRLTVDVSLTLARGLRKVTVMSPGPSTFVTRLSEPATSWSSQRKRTFRSA